MTDQEKIELLRGKLLFAQGIIGNLNTYVQRYRPCREDFEGWKDTKRNGVLAVRRLEEALSATK